MENTETGAQPKNFQGRGGFVELEYVDRHLLKTQKKKVPQGKMFEFPLPDTLKTTFWMDGFDKSLFFTQN